MMAGSAIPPPHKNRSGPGGAVILRLVLVWSFWVLGLVSIGESMRVALIRCESVVPSLRAAASCLSTAWSVLASTGIVDPLKLLRLS